MYKCVYVCVCVSPSLLINTPIPSDRAAFRDNLLSLCSILISCPLNPNNWDNWEFLTRRCFESSKLSDMIPLSCVQSTILCLISLSCVWLRYLASHYIILCLCYFVSHSVILYLTSLFRVSFIYVVSHLLTLCLIQLSCVSFSNFVSQSAIIYLIQQYRVSFRHLYPITLSLVSFRSTASHSATLFVHYWAWNTGMDYWLVWL
jgi:hypothetical protein